LYCFEFSDLSEIFAHIPDSNDVVAIYNCKDAYLWRKKDAPRSRSRHAA
jgi:hypothetical protein